MKMMDHDRNRDHCREDVVVVVQEDQHNDLVVADDTSYDKKNGTLP